MQLDKAFAYRIFAKPVPAISSFIQGEFRYPSKIYFETDRSAELSAGHPAGQEILQCGSTAGFIMDYGICSVAQGTRQEILYGSMCYHRPEPECLKGSSQYRMPRVSVKTRP